MGFSIHYFDELFETLNKLKLLEGDTSFIGDLKIYSGKGNPIISPKEILKKKYGMEYTSFDINGNADKYIDLTEDLDDIYKEKYDLIIDSGTLEHIFDQYNAYKNIYNMCKVNGHILFIEPYNAPDGHSFYRYDRKFFTEMARVNKMDTIIDYNIIVKGNNFTIIKDGNLPECDYINHMFLFKKNVNEFKTPTDIND